MFLHLLILAFGMSLTSESARTLPFVSPSNLCKLFFCHAIQVSEEFISQEEKKSEIMIE
jgi:hypothetical protein